MKGSFVSLVKHPGLYLKMIRLQPVIPVFSKYVHFTAADFFHQMSMTNYTNKKCSNELSTKALLGRKYALVDSTSRIQTVLELVFQQVILHSSCFQSENI